MSRRPLVASLGAPLLFVPLVALGLAVPSAAAAPIATQQPTEPTTPQVTPITPTITAVPATPVRVRPVGPRELATVVGQAVEATSTAATEVIPAERSGGFSLVGLTWAGVERPGTAVRVRTQDPNGAWSPVIDLPLVEQLAPGQVRRGTEAVWTGRAVRSEVEITSPDGVFPSEIVINLIDPMQQDPGTRSTRAPIAGAAPKTSATAPAVPGVSASALPSLGTVNTNVAMPRINARAAWGADESMRLGAPQYQSRVKALVIHHSAGSNSYACSEVPAMMRGLYAYAVQTLGWDRYSSLPTRHLSSLNLRAWT